MNRLFILISLLVLMPCCSKPEEEAGMDKNFLSITPVSLTFSAESSTLSISLTAGDDWTLTASDWISFTPNSGKGGNSPRTIFVSVTENTGEIRTGSLTVTSASGKTATVKITQKAPEKNPVINLKGKRYLVIANSMVYYGGFVQYGSQGGEDIGMFNKILKAHDMEGTVIDCTYGNHRLTDYLEAGCNTTTSHGDHLSKIDLKSIDYVILCAEGSNPSSFLKTCRALYKRVTDVNPNAAKVYINHVYSVFNKHSNILGNLKTLHEEDGVTIVNCGQLAYDIYTGAVKVPGGSKVYKDRYTFVNHTSSDTHHPNPLMGYIMTQMTFCALTGETPYYSDYLNLIKSCKYSSTGSLAYDSYYSKFYTTPAALPFMEVLNDPAEMAGIQQMIPLYINKY